LFCEIDAIFFLILRYTKKTKYLSMAKIYTKEKNVSPKMLPKKETIDFILSYSKAMKVVKVGDQHIETFSN
jgi:hypothetical protein